jgi:hypothetical protein
MSVGLLAGTASLVLPMVARADVTDPMQISVGAETTWTFGAPQPIGGGVFVEDDILFGATGPCPVYGPYPIPGAVPCPMAGVYVNSHWGGSRPWEILFGARGGVEIAGHGDIHFSDLLSTQAEIGLAWSPREPLGLTGGLRIHSATCVSWRADVIRRMDGLDLRVAAGLGVPLLPVQDGIE